MVNTYSGYSFRPSPTAFGLVAAGLILSSFVALRRNSQANPSQTTERAAIYAADPNNAWNRIFYCLFTRTVKAHLSNEFDGKPFTRIQYAQFPHELTVSTRLFDRVESGDRAIEPLYPSFFSSQGVLQVLSEPLFSQLKQALEEALEQKTASPPLDRALMQSDVWGAYDLLFRNSHFNGAESQQFLERSDQLLHLLARLIKKTALTQNEIEMLADNYAAAAGGYGLPGLFAKNTGWMEVQWRPDREHDHSTDYRRATRIFIKAASKPRDKQEFLNSLRNAPDITSKLDAVALVTQNLLIDSSGKVVPSRLTYDVQIRGFIRNERGLLIRTEIQEYELSRRLLLTKPTSGGLVALDDKSPVYLPASGNDYGFASRLFNQRGDGPPVLVTLRSRCIACHGQNVSAVFTFTTNMPELSPPVAQLTAASNEHAFYVADRKMERTDFRALSAPEKTK
jgi:hypothetical protein